MAVIAQQTNRRYDLVFFPSLAALMLITAFTGFARTYYLAGLFRAPLPNLLIQIHAAAFSCWLLLLVVQMGLVTARRVDLHKKLGLAGFGLAALMVMLGLLAATDSLRRGFAPPGSGLSAQTFYVVPLSAMLIFSILVLQAYRLRVRPAVHKRLVIVATVALLGAAIGRWPFAFMQRGPVVQALCEYAFLALLAGYDLVSTGRVQRVTLWASACLIVVEQVRIPLAMTSAWQAFAHAMR